MADADESGVLVLEPTDIVAQDELSRREHAVHPCLHLISNLGVLGGEIDKSDAGARRHGITATDTPFRATDSLTASRARTTARPSTPPVSGCRPDRMHSRKCSHSARSGSPIGTRGIVTSPSRTLARKVTKVSA